MSLNDWTVVETEHLQRLIRISKAYLAERDVEIPDIESSIYCASLACIELHDYNMQMLAYELIDHALGIDELRKRPR